MGAARMLMIKHIHAPPFLGAAWAVVLIACMATVSFAHDEILILYNERSPYVVVDPGGKLSGLTVDPVRYAFEKSGLEHRWELTPSKRQLGLIESSEIKACAVGWFKNPEREKIGKYTHEVYKDNSTVAVTKANNDRMVSGKTLDALFADKSLTLLTKGGFSYGPFIDGKIAAGAPVRMETVTENMNMLKFIQAGRADYMFMAPEEADALIATKAFKPGAFKLVTFSDMPEGESRYLLCSHMVPDADIERLNTSLQEYRDKICKR